MLQSHDRSTTKYESELVSLMTLFEVVFKVICNCLFETFQESFHAREFSLGALQIIAISPVKCD